MSWGNDNDPSPIDAVKALRARGVNIADELLVCGTPAQILAACHRWDSEKHVGPGVLVHRIRNGNFESQPPSAPSKAAIMQARFEEYAARFPEGSIAEPHARLQARRWPGEDPCQGGLVVIETTYPNIIVECDQCGFEAAYPVRALHILGPVLRTARPLPDLAPEPDDQPF